MRLLRRHRSKPGKVQPKETHYATAGGARLCQAENTPLTGRGDAAWHFFRER